MANRKTPTVLREPVYLVDFAVYKPDDDLKISLKEFSELALNWKIDGKLMEPEVLSFVEKVYEKSGIDAKGSFLPKNLNPKHTKEPKGGVAESFAEARLVMGGAVEEILKKTGIRADEIDVMIVVSSVFVPTPSLSSMLVNMFNMREDVQAYALGGMGCGAGVIGINLVRDVLQAHPGANALYVTAEICSSAFYEGKDQRCLVSNGLFRMGASAAILTSGRNQKYRSKYKLTHSERIHTGSSDSAYNCMYFGPDEAGYKGIHLYKDLPAEAGIALQQCLRKVTPRIMTWGQYAEAAVSICKRKWHGKDKVAAYQPDYTRCVKHFCMHAGGYAILTGIQKSMRLPAESMMASFANLKDYGNTSSSTTWYSWAYIESVEGVKKGNKLMQAGVGGGVKAGINIWKALKDITDNHPAWEHLAGKAYTEADLPRPITRKEDVGTLTGVKEFDEAAGNAKDRINLVNLKVAAEAAVTAAAAAPELIAAVKVGKMPLEPQSSGRRGTGSVKLVSCGSAALVSEA